jgi:SEC-C motif-containing protein
MFCFCNSGKPVESCCKPYLSGVKVATRPEALMRSRYSAFSQGNVEYLLSTSSKSLALSLDKEDLEKYCQTTKFVRLDVIKSEGNTVEFIASLIEGDILHQIHELSSFIVENERLVYDTGNLYPVPSQKLSRNIECPCGSGKKYKRCHMK